MLAVGFLEFRRRFGELQHPARRKPEAITRHGWREFVSICGPTVPILNPCTDHAPERSGNRRHR